MTNSYSSFTPEEKEEFDLEYQEWLDEQEIDNERLTYTEANE